MEVEKGPKSADLLVKSLYFSEIVFYERLFYKKRTAFGSTLLIARIRAQMNTKLITVRKPKAMIGPK